MMLRLLLSSGLLACLSLTPAQSAPGAPQPAGESLEEPITRETASGDVDSAYRAARERDDARQRLWDAKMKALSESVCTGC